MPTNFSITGYITHAIYPNRFAKAKFFDFVIIVDSWSGLINGTKFCAMISNSKKRFDTYLRSSKNRELVKTSYSKIQPINKNWKDVYIFQNDLYIIKSSVSSIQEIGGTYVHYYSIIDLGFWCNKKLFSIFCDLITHLYNNFCHDKESRILDVTKMLNHKLSLSETYLNELSGRIENIDNHMFDIFTRVFPQITFEKITDNMFKHNNILIKVDTGEKDEQIIDNIIFTIIISFVNTSMCNMENNEIVINHNDIIYYLSLIEKLLNQKDIPKKSAHDICLEEYNTRLEEYNEIASQLPFDIDIEATLNNISSHRNKKKYMEYYYDGNIRKIAQNLVCFIYK